MADQEDSSSSSSSSSQDEKTQNDQDQTINTTTISTTSYNYDDFFNQVHPVHLLFFGSIPLCLGAYAGYKIEMNRVTTASDHYSPGSISSGRQLLRKFIREEGKQGNSLLSKNGVTSNHALSSTISQSLLSLSSSSSTTSTSTSTSTSLKNIAAHTATTAEHPNMVKVDTARLAFKALGIGSMLSIGGVGLLTAGIFKVCGCNNLEEMVTMCKEWTPRKRRELEKRFGIEPKSMQHEDVKATKGMTEEEEWEYIKKKYIPELAVDGKDDDYE